MKNTNRLSFDEFVPFAPDTVGEQVHVEHCKPGRAKLYIKRTENGILAFCHHCNHSGAYLNSMESASKREDVSRTGISFDHRQSESGNDGYGAFSLPADTEGRAGHWPRDAREWAEQFLTEQELTDSPFCYSERAGGILFPYYSREVLAGYQVRLFPDRKGMKYKTVRNKSLPNDVALASFHPDKTPVKPDFVLVEDWISAYKCKLAGYASQALMSTNLTKGRLYPIVADWPRIIVALDNDNKQVKKAQAKLVRDLSCYSQVKSVLLERDLKYETIDRIREILNG